MHSASDGNWDREAIVFRARGISKGALSTLTRRWICFLHTVLMMYPYGSVPKTDEAMLARDVPVHESVPLL